MQYQTTQLQKSIRQWLAFFMVCLVLSGLTALDVETGVWWLSGHFGQGAVQVWIEKVLFAIRAAKTQSPFIFYGFDWLAFGHIAIAVAFVGPYQQPVRNIWVVQFGRIVAFLVIPYALVAGHFRGIPFWWQVVDCSFGIVALWPLTQCYQQIKKLEALEAKMAEPATIASKCQYRALFQ